MKKLLKISLLSLITLAFLCAGSEARKPARKGPSADPASILNRIDAKKEALKGVNAKIKEEVSSLKAERQKKSETKLKELEKTDPEKAKLIRAKIAGKEAEAKLSKGKKKGKNVKMSPAKLAQIKARNPELFALMQEKHELQGQITGMKKNFKAATAKKHKKTRKKQND